MKKVLFCFSLFFCNYLLGGNCSELIAKYNAPDPTTKTMAQISRWIERKVGDNPSDARELESCLIANAADNPNKEQVAGR